MTPTLYGRWQTRILLLLTLGMAISLFYAILAFALFGTFLAFFSPFVVLFFVLFAGLGWDVIYILLQRFRWDRDWPPVFVFFAGVAEMFPAWAVAWFFGVPWWLFLLHYWSVWLAVFIWSFGPMRIIFHRWRYHGGQWI